MKPMDLTKGKVSKVLVGLALPLMGSSLLQFTYNFIDTLFVGRLGSGSVASVGSSSFFLGLGYAINALVVIGTGIKVSHAMGKGEQGEVKAYIKAGVILNSVLAISYMLFLILFGKHLIGFLNLASHEVAQGSYIYLAWSAPMLFFAFFNTLFARILGSLGNTKSPLKISAIGILINILLDPLFIYGMGWGVAGAAIATLVANTVMFGCYLKVGQTWQIKWLGDKQFLTLHKQKERFKEIISLGFPNACQRVLFTLVNILLAKMIAQFGTDAIAAQKIGLQIESIVYMVTGGLNGAMASFTGQNYGAKAAMRIRKGYSIALRLGMIYAILSAIVFIIFPGQLAQLFVSEPKTIAITMSYLSIIAYSQVFNGLEMVSNGLFTGLGKPKIPAIVSVSFTILRIPMAYVLSKWLGVAGIWWAISGTTILKGCTLYSLYHLKAKPMIQALKEER